MECFRPGDVVRCSVTSLGDKRSYFVTTASDDLGVVSAKSEGGECSSFVLDWKGEAMEAISLVEMRAPSSGVIESRKVADVLKFVVSQTE